MNPEKQRIAIAEACGCRKWQEGDPFMVGQCFADSKFNGFRRRVVAIYPDGVTLDVDESPLYKTDRFGHGKEFMPLTGWCSKNGVWKLRLPDYLTDLNAMHEAEKVLTENQRMQYSDELYSIALKAHKETKQWRWLSSTAAQRAEAFLRTIGKWEHDK